MPAHCVSVVKMASSLILKVFVVGNLKGKEQHGWMDGCALRVMHVLQHYIMCLEIYRIIFEMLQILSKRCWAVKVLHMDEGTLPSQYDPPSSIINNRHPSSSSSSTIIIHHEQPLCSPLDQTGCRLPWRLPSQLGSFSQLESR